MAYHHILRQNSSFNLIKSSLMYNHFVYCSSICKSLLCHRLEFKSLQNAVKFISTNNFEASDLTLAKDNLFRDIYRNLRGPIVFLSRKRAFEIANKIIADHREFEKCFMEEIATIEKSSKEEVATIEKNFREEIATIEKKSREMVATIVVTIGKKFREEVAMIEKRLQAAQNDYRDLLIRFMRVRRNFNLRGAIEWAAQNDYRDLLIRFMRVRRNFNLRGAIEWVREQVSKGNYGDYSLLSIPLAITQSSTATNVQNKSSESTTPPYTSPSDKRLVQLMKNTTFSENLLKICEINKMTESHVRTCIAGLYHQLSKQANGYDKQEIAIDARFFTSNEILALGFIFRIYNISYLYYDDSGQLNNFPFKI
ncbi:hypothetical protein Glove_330g129 [Diversispora epigaea]|uniref:Uncharacterized protein n=1 Tax=Diversispora epigaea TaxID=1348612 RepID=A0A397HS32_9GLOM|nr:hypothetical protein Glove_330g129 [Diversispora epigaea]